MPYARSEGYESIGDGPGAGSANLQRSRNGNGGGSRGRGKNIAMQWCLIVFVMATVTTVCFDSHVKIRRKGGSGLNFASSRTMSLTGKTGKTETAECICPQTPTRVDAQEGSVEFELPLGAKPGQLLHMLVPGHRYVQPVCVPQSARAGMMMSVNIKRPTKSTLADKGTPGQGESGASFVGEVEEDAEMVEEDTKMAGEDVVSLCQCVSLPLFPSVCVSISCNFSLLPGVWRAVHWFVRPSLVFEKPLGMCMISWLLS